MQSLVKYYSVEDFLTDYDLSDPSKRILNAGSSSVRYGENCVNVDIKKKANVDVVCDIHDLPCYLGEFDAIICNAVLQYCRSPEEIAKRFYQILKPGGYLFIDAPWIQPYCPDTPDRFRFSQDGLRTIFCDFRIIRIGPSISSGSAFAMLGFHIARNLTHNKYVNYGLSKFARIMLYSFRYISTDDESQTAGAFYLICQKSA